jgi:hypothetical protein
MNRVMLDSGAGIAEPTLSNDETDLIFTTANVPSESTRTDATTDFGPVSPLTSLTGAVAITSVAWLSPNRLTLYAIASDSGLYQISRPTLGDNFLPPGNKVVPNNVQDATLVANEHRLVYATGGVLKSILYVTNQPPAVSQLLSKGGELVFSPSIGDHDRTIVWSESEQAMPMMSNLWIGELTDSAVLSPQMLSLPQPMYYAGAILSYDGATLYFTAAADTGMMADLYNITRSCLDGH